MGDNRNCKKLTSKNQNNRKKHREKNTQKLERK